MMRFLARLLSRRTWPAVDDPGPPHRSERRERLHRLHLLQGTNPVDVMALLAQADLWLEEICPGRDENDFWLFAAEDGQRRAPSQRQLFEQGGDAHVASAYRHLSETLPAHAHDLRNYGRLYAERAERITEAVLELDQRLLAELELAADDLRVAEARAAGRDSQTRARAAQLRDSWMAESQGDPRLTEWVTRWRAAREDLQRDLDELQARKSQLLRDDPTALQSAGAPDRWHFADADLQVQEDALTEQLAELRREALRERAELLDDIKGQVERRVDEHVSRERDRAAVEVEQARAKVERLRLRLVDSCAEADAQLLRQLRELAERMTASSEAGNLLYRRYLAIRADLPDQASAARRLTDDALWRSLMTRYRPGLH